MLARLQAEECSFCSKPAAEVRGFAGIEGQPARICEECVAFCVDLMADEADKRVRTMTGAPAPPPPTPEELQRLEHEAAARVLDWKAINAAMQAARKVLDAGARSDFHWPPACSFCGSARRDRQKIISGPHVFICEVCTTEATTLFSDWLGG